MELKTKQIIVNYAIDKLNDLKGSTNIYGCDLHHNIFNLDYFIIGYAAAENWLIENYGIFSAIDTIKEYEQNNFGNVSTDLSSSEKVVNMLVYILGEEVLSEAKHLNSVWDSRLTDKDINKIIKELKTSIKYFY